MISYLKKRVGIRELFRLRLVLVSTPFIGLALMTSNAMAKDTVLTVPIVLDIATLESKLNAAIPTVIVNQPAKRHVCIPAEYFTSSWLGIKTKITPEVSCNVSGNVRRMGPIKLVASGNSIIGTVALAGSATVSSRGAIHIQESAQGRLTLTLKITPSINSNWQISSGAEISHSWTQRPRAKLFNIIPITFGTEADKEINKYKTTLPAEIDKHLNDLNVRSIVTQVWTNLQQPHLIAPSPKTYLQLQPKAIGISKLQTSAKAVSLTVFIKSATEVVLGSPRSMSKTSLPNLSQVPKTTSSLSVNVPIRASFDDISKILADEFNLPGEQDIDGVFGQTFTLRYGNPKFHRQHSQSIRIVVPSQLIAPGKYPRDFRVELTAKPIVDWQNKSVSVKLRSSNIYVGDDSEPSIIYQLLFSGVAKNIEEKFNLSFEEAMKKIERQVTQSSNAVINNNLRLNASKPVYSYGGFKVDDAGVSVIVGLTGNANLHYTP